MKADNMTFASPSTVEHGSGTSFLADLKDWATTLIAARRAAAATRALRRELSDMDDTLLRDIGISEGEIWHIRQLRDTDLRAL